MQPHLGTKEAIPMAPRPETPQGRPFSTGALILIVMVAPFFLLMAFLLYGLKP